VEAAALLSDADLVARCREGDANAWNELVERFSRYVYAIAVRGFRLSEADAEDVFQDVFARTYEQLDRLRDDAAVRPCSRSSPGVSASTVSARPGGRRRPARRPSQAQTMTGRRGSMRR
jgi:hypothetical protein